MTYLFLAIFVIFIPKRGGKSWRSIKTSKNSSSDKENFDFSTQEIKHFSLFRTWAILVIILEVFL